MSIHFDDSLMAIYFVALPKHDDWMAALHQLGPDSYKLTYRFRYADPLEPGADPFENIDRKSWSTGTFSGMPPAEALARVHGIARDLARKSKTRLHAVVRKPGESTEQYMLRFSREPYAQMKVVKPGTPEWDEYVKGDAPDKAKP